MNIQWIIIAIVIIIAVFLILREFVCWYWKINERVSLLEDILEELKKMNGSENKEEKGESVPPKIETNKKEEEQEIEDDDEEEVDPDEPVEDPFWNKKN